jgi:small subunit ribosomal protein S6
MRSYELGVIIDASLEEPEALARVKSITEAIAAKGGSVVGKPDWWGKRRFAYEIKKKTEGYYVFYNVVAEGGALDDFERSLRLADDIVRHKLIRLPDAEAARRGMSGAGSAA